MSEEKKPEPQQLLTPQQTTAPRPSTGRTAAEVWLAEAKIVPVDDNE